MAVSWSEAWRQPGCGEACLPRRHDPATHEAHGFALALLAQRVAPVRIVRTGPLVIDLAAARVTSAGQVVPVSGREWRVLAYLATRPGRPCTATELLRSIWGPEWVTGRRRRHRRGFWMDVDHQVIRTWISRLRARLGDARSLVVTVPVGIGVPAYRLELEEPTP